jgi:hypothetical protein
MNLYVFIYSYALEIFWSLLFDEPVWKQSLPQNAVCDSWTVNILMLPRFQNGWSQMVLIDP